MTRAAACAIAIVLISIQLGAASISPPRNQASAASGPSDEEYEIYSAAVIERYVRPDTKLIMIEDRTFRYDFSNENDEPWKDKVKDKDKKKGIAIDPSAAEDYEAKNGRQSLLNKASFKLPVKLTMIGDLDLRAIFHGKWRELEWIAYYKKYPDADGFLMLSRVGFNSDHTQALLYLGSRCGAGCGEINFLLLEKANGTWATRKELRKKRLGS